VKLPRGPGSALWLTVIGLGLGLVAAVMAGIGHGLTTSLAAVALAGMLTVAVAAPRAGLYMVLLAAPFRGVFMIESLDWSAVRLLGVALVVGAVGGWVWHGRWPRVHRAAWVLAGLVPLAAVSVLWSHSLGSWGGVLALGQYVVLAVIVADVARTEHALAELCVVLGVAAMTTALVVIGDYVPFALAAEEWSAGARFQWEVDPNSTLLSTWFAVAIPVTLLTQVLPVGPRWKRASWLLLVAPVVALIALTSRIVLVACAGMLVVYLAAGRGLLWRLPRAGGVLGAFVACALAMTALGLTYPDQAVRLGEGMSGSHNVTSGRTVIWDLGVRVFARHPVRGVGLGGFEQAFEAERVGAHPLPKTRPARAPHNDFLGLAAEVGVLGPVLLLWALVWLAWPLLRAGPEARVAPAAAWLGGMVLLMLGLDTLELMHTWVGLGVVMAIGRLVSPHRPPRPV
jgi:hypothetical protein